jgi:hypothetical protein
METIRFKSPEHIGLEAFYSCRVLNCSNEAEKLYATESNIVDICQEHYNNLTEKE